MTREQLRIEFLRERCREQFQPFYRTGGIPHFGDDIQDQFLDTLCLVVSGQASKAQVEDGLRLTVERLKLEKKLRYSEQRIDCLERTVQAVKWILQNAKFTVA